ncbi:putative multidrug resistance protein MdtD [Streptomyces sp. RB5]|uniref:Putative multidrug resistance protein MdtD n=1 Tax=Streptomyces smaragdinus TaxID=2585196 RepID=A0A7K0CBT5_9ACTN|nr:MFS transporter [Streptomyces smaragdinus]MQY10911.1 putative multidrug resistance protein MdtD [Streptomyces smaragdinus]
MKRSPWATLVVLAFAQFIVVLDVTIVNVALPDIQSDLDFSTDSLQWVINAYTLLFGGGLLAVVYGVVRAEPVGWSSFEVIGCLVAGIAMLVGFALVESRVAAPLVPLRLLRTRSLSTASGVLALNGAGFLSMFFLTAIFLQQVRHSSPLDAGLEFLPMGGIAIVGGVVATPLVTRFGTRPVQFGGALVGTAGLLLLTGADADGSYAGELLPGLLLFGFAVVLVAVPAQIAAISDVSAHEAGAASGVVTALNQVGGALGLAVVSTLSNSKAASELAHGSSASDALVAGFHRGLLIAAAFLVVAMVVTATSPRVKPSAEQIAEATAAA